MNFSVQTIYDKERLVRFNSFIALRKRFFWSVLILGTVLITACLAIFIVLDPHNSSIWFCAGFVYIIDVTYAFCYFVLPRFIVNKSPILNANILFEFHEDFFKISATLKNGTESSELNYSAVVKLMESKQDIYLFISQRQCYILDKSSFTVGCSEDFLKFLQEKNITYKR